MRNFLITALIVWGSGFFIANSLATAVDAKLDSLTSDRNEQLCQYDSSFCKS